MASLRLAHVQLNPLALRLFDRADFTTMENISFVETIELSVAQLGLPSGGVFAQILECAEAASLSLCPLELAAHLRLQFIDQPEGFTGHPPSKNRAPPGSLTIVSPSLSEDDDIPKGFYLRRIEGVLWLRGYASWAGHTWSPEDMLLFSRGAIVA